jgi:hypothetical protein
MKEHVQMLSSGSPRNIDLIPQQLSAGPDDSLLHIGQMRITTELFLVHVEQHVLIKLVHFKERVAQLADVHPCPVVFVYRPEHKPDT